MNLVESTHEGIEGYFQREVDHQAMLEIRKTIQREMITKVYAPILLCMAQGQKRNFDKAVDGQLEEARKELQFLQGQVDQSIQGDFAKEVGKKMDRIKETIEQI